MNLRNILSNFNIPIIEKNTNYWFLKTSNGKYYSQFINESRVMFHNKLIKNEFSDLNEYVSSLIMTYKNKEILNFINNVNKNDLIFIPSVRNKYITSGEVISLCNIKNSLLTRCVKWNKEYSFNQFDIKYHKILHQTATFFSLNSINNYLERLLYRSYFKNDKFHICINVNQNNNILFKSIYGLQNLIFNDKIYNDIEIKINIESPGIIEFITSNLEVIMVIIKVLNIISIVNKYYKNRKISKIEDELIKVTIKENEDLIEKYFNYDVDKLQLDVDFNNIDYKELKKYL